MGFVGGDHHQISSAGSALQKQSKTVGSFSTGIHKSGTEAEGGADSPFVGAMSRFSAAYGAFTDGVETELLALGKLASVTGADIEAATSGHAR